MAIGPREREERGQEAGEGAKLQEAMKPLIDLGGRGQRCWRKVTVGEDSRRSPSVIVATRKKATVEERGFSTST